MPYVNSMINIQINSKFTEISPTHKNTYDLRFSLLRQDSRDLARMFSETTSKLWKTNPPTCSSMSIARLKSYFFSGSDISAPICLLSGLRARITANRKDWYTLLLEFPIFISLKLQMAVLKEVSFRSIKNAFVSLNTLTQQKGNVSETGYPQLFISTRYNQPAHRV